MWSNAGQVAMSFHIGSSCAMGPVRKGRGSICQSRDRPPSCDHRECSVKARCEQGHGSEDLFIRHTRPFTWTARRFAPSCSDLPGPFTLACAATILPPVYSRRFAPRSVTKTVLKAFVFSRNRHRFPET
jgi:hypothetical protein